MTSSDYKTLLTFPSLVTANMVCSPPMICTGLSSEKLSHSLGTLILLPSIPPSWPLWLWPQPYMENELPSGIVQSLGYLHGRTMNRLEIVLCIIPNSLHILLTRLIAQMKMLVTGSQRFYLA